MIAEAVFSAVITTGIAVTADLAEAGAAFGSIADGSTDDALVTGPIAATSAIANGWKFTAAAATE
jgi:hypothetical protein